MMFKTKERKGKSIGKLKKEVRAIFSQYIRLRDALKATGDPNYCVCITCTKLIPVKEAQAGHFIDCRHSATLFDETNVHAQCARCNVYLDGNILEYRRQIIRLYGEGYDVQLEMKAVETKKFTKAELIELKELYTQKIKELESSY
jgi:hypothetical protein